MGELREVGGARQRIASGTSPPDGSLPEVGSELARYRRLCALLPKFFFYAHGTDGVFQFVSASAEDCMGYTQEEFLLHFATYLTDHASNAKVIAATQASLRGEKQPPYEVQLFHKNGNKMWLEVEEAPVFNALGQVVSVEGIAHDITARKQRAADREALIVALTDAVERVQALSSLVPICAECKEVRDERGNWHGIEDYFAKRADILLTHGICPTCLPQLYPQVAERIAAKAETPTDEPT